MSVWTSLKMSNVNMLKDRPNSRSTTASAHSHSWYIHTHTRGIFIHAKIKLIVPPIHTSVDGQRGHNPARIIHPPTRPPFPWVLLLVTSKHIRISHCNRAEAYRSPGCDRCLRFCIKQTIKKRNRFCPFRKAQLSPKVSLVTLHLPSGLCTRAARESDACRGCCASLHIGGRPIG